MRRFLGLLLAALVMASFAAGCESDGERVQRKRAEKAEEMFIRAMFALEQAEALWDKCLEGWGRAIGVDVDGVDGGAR